jgi:nitroreductase
MLKSRRSWFQTGLQAVSVLWQRVWGLADRYLVAIAASQRWLAAIYYTICNAGFSYEQRAFLRGRRAYAQALVAPRQSMALLRRYIHRLEKGLLMQPRRVPFGLGYLGRTVKAYVTAVGSGQVHPGELQWAHDVLTEYFRVCDGHPAVRTWQERFAATASPLTADLANPCIPYCRQEATRGPITVEHLLQLARYRRSVRWFLPQPVPREMIDSAVIVGGYSPSACNRQPYEFRIIDDPELLRVVTALPLGTAGYAHNIPCLAVVIGNQRNYFDERDRHLIYIDGSLAIMAFIFALEAQGLSTCCINWPEIAVKDDEMAAALGLQGDQRPIMCVAIGYPDPQGQVAYSAKKDLSIIRRYNFE